MLVGATQKDTPLALVAENAWAVPLSIVIFVAAILGLYAWTKREAAAPVA